MNDQKLKDVIKERYGKIARGEVRLSAAPPAGRRRPTSAWPWAIPRRTCAWCPNWRFWGWAAATPRRWRTSRKAKRWWTWAPARASTSSWRPKRSGKHGRVIGVDMTEDMVAKGRQLAQEHGFGNVEFRLGYIEHLPVESATVDVIISNCVINLTPDKLASFKEIHRVLKPGGRILIADLVTAGELPPDVRASAAAWADCLAGAMEKEEYLDTIRRAGFADVAVISESPYEAPEMDGRLQGKILSVKVRAFKR